MAIYIILLAFVGVFIFLRLLLSPGLGYNRYYQDGIPPMYYREPCYHDSGYFHYRREQSERINVSFVFTLLLAGLILFFGYSSKINPETQTTDKAERYVGVESDHKAY